MASLALKMSVSLDGYVAPPDGSSEWVAAGRSDDGARWTVETLRSAGAHLIGATTYAGWAGYRPSASGPIAGRTVELDEYRLVVHPVVLGAGERLFTEPLTIEPTSTTVFGGGAVARVFAARP